MAEEGCLKDGCFHNLQVEGRSMLAGTTVVEGKLRSSTLLQSHASVGKTHSSIAATATAAVNTFYVVTDPTDLIVTLPSAGDGNIGDFINIFYTTAIANANPNTFADPDDGFVVGSTVQRVGGGSASMANVSVVSQDTITIMGETNGDGGVGTSLKFVNTTGAKSGWMVEAITYNQGSGATLGTIDFSEA